MKFREGLFEQGNNVFIADEVEVDTIICLSNCRYFYVFDIDNEFINDEVAKLYEDADDNVEIPPEHTKITFYDEKDNEITDIPGTAHVIVFARINGAHNPFRLD